MRPQSETGVSEAGVGDITKLCHPEGRREGRGEGKVP